MQHVGGFLRAFPVFLFPDVTDLAQVRQLWPQEDIVTKDSQSSGTGMGPSTRQVNENSRGAAHKHCF